MYSLIINPWFGLNFLLGVFGLAIVTTLYFARKSSNILILLFLLGIGTINIVSFNEAFSFEFYFFNIINILLFTILLYKKRNFLSALNEKWFGTSKVEYQEERTGEIESFKRRFADLSEVELNKKLKDALTDSAKIAVLQLLNKPEN